MTATMPTPQDLAAELRSALAQANQLAAALVAALDQLQPDPDPDPDPGPPAAPAKPTGLTCAIDAGRPVLTWDAAAGVDEWDVRDELNLAKPVQATVTEPRSVRSALKPGQRRRYTVVARNELGESAASAAVEVIGAGPTPEPAPAPKPTPSPAPGPTASRHPSDVLDLRNWTIMLPTGSQGDPDNEYVIGRAIPDVLFVRPDGGVVFRAPAGGVHSPNSKFCRTEARQMSSTKWGKAAWPSSESHWLECELAIDASGLTARKRINGMQIHDGGDDVCQIMRHDTQGLVFAHNDGKSLEPIDPDYRDGTRFTCSISVAGNRIRVHYNGRQVVDVAKTGSGWYWKMGCYLQTDVPNYGELPGATGEVVIWRYQLGA